MKYITNAIRLFQWGAVPLAFIILWQCITGLGVIERVFLPSPIDVFSRLYTLVIKAEVLPDFLATMNRTILSFILSMSLGIPIGLCLGFFRGVYNYSEFMLDFLRSIPATAIFPLFLLLFSVGNGSKIAMATYSSVFVIIINTIYGVWNVSQTRIIMARTFHATNIQIIVKIVFYDALPSIFSGLRNALSICLILTVVSEMFVGTNRGLGFAVYNAKIAYDTPTMYAIIILMGAIGYLSNKILLTFERVALPWIKNNGNQ